jgi:8-oxo-dGTP pyrophosphatase MutT (NUDIX family)
MNELASTQVCADARLSVRTATIRRPDGSTGTWTVVDGADVVLVVPLDGDRLHLVEQYRHPVGGRRWEFPSGSIETRLDADEEAVARRELREETGLRAGVLTRLGRVEVMPSTLSQRCSVFLATGPTRGEPERDPEEQDMRSAWFTRSEVERMVVDGTISDGKSLAAYALLLTSRSAQGSHHRDTI